MRHFCFRNFKRKSITSVLSFFTDEAKFTFRSMRNKCIQKSLKKIKADTSKPIKLFGENIYKGHSNFIICSVMMNDNYVATGAHHGEVIIWDIETQKAIDKFAVEESVLSMIYFGKSDNLIIGMINEILFYTKRAFKSIKKLSKDSLISLLIIDESKNTFAYSTSNNSVHICSYNKLKSLYNVTCTIVDVYEIRSMLYMKNNIYGGNKNGKVNVYNIDKKNIEFLYEHKSSVIALIRLGICRIASGSCDGQIKLYEVIDHNVKKEVLFTTSVKKSLYSLIALKGNSWLIAGCSDSLNILNITSNSTVKVYIYEGFSVVNTLLKINDYQIGIGSWTTAFELMDIDFSFLEEQLSDEECEVPEKNYRLIEIPNVRRLANDENI